MNKENSINFGKLKGTRLGKVQCWWHRARFIRLCHTTKWFTVLFMYVRSFHRKRLAQWIACPSVIFSLRYYCFYLCFSFHSLLLIQKNCIIFFAFFPMDLVLCFRFSVLFFSKKVFFLLFLVVFLWILYAFEWVFYDNIPSVWIISMEPSQSLWLNKFSFENSHLNFDSWIMVCVCMFFVCVSVLDDLGRK